MSRFQVVRDDVYPRAGGLLGDGDGLLGLPTLSLPDIGSIIGIPPKSTPTPSLTSSIVTPTISLTTLSRASTTADLTTSTSAITTSGSTTALSTTSATDTTTTAAGTAATNSLTTSDTPSLSLTTSASATSDTASATVTPPPTDTATVTEPFGASGSLTFSSSAAASQSSAADNAPKSFLQNKPLSVGVITAASIVGLILLIILGTWAIRKRRNDRLDRDILDFSTSNLVNGADLEKTGAAEVGSSLGHGSGSSSGHGSLPPPVQSRQMYQENYNAPVFAPRPPPSRNANPYGQPAYNASGYNGYQSTNAYNNNQWGYGYGNAAAPTQAEYDQQAYAGYDDAYAGMAGAGVGAGVGAMTGVGAGAQNTQAPQRRPSANRKPPPQLIIPPTNPIAQPVNALSPVSTESITKPPLQPAAARPALPDEFGASPPPVEEPSRRLVVRNE